MNESVLKFGRKKEMGYLFSLVLSFLFFLGIYFKFGVANFNYKNICYGSCMF